MLKINLAKKIVYQTLNDSGAVLQRIEKGQDGVKFKITTSKGDLLFGRVKKENNSQELPYQEKVILDKVNCQHVIKPIITDRIKGHFVIIRPFINGVSLEERLQKKPLELEEIKKLAETLVDCVNELALVGAVHFDIKPANIIVGEDNRFYLIDFGTAKFIRKISKEKIHPARKYIAPEVLKYLFNPSELSLQQLSPFSDMYGVGAVLYSVITGHNISEFFKFSSDILQKMPPPIKFFKPGFDPRITNMVELLLSKEPSRRLRSDDAKILLNGGSIPIKSAPLYFLKTKPGRGSEHTQMLDTIINSGNLVGIYWISTTFPELPKKVPVHNMIWEIPWRNDAKFLERDLLRQYRCGVLALCVPGIELENPVNAGILSNNLKTIDRAIEWKKKVVNHLPIFIVINIDEALLTSTAIGEIRNAYASKNVDGIIIRISVPTNKMTLDVRHFKAIKNFILPWASRKRTVLFDGDLSALPLVFAGVSGLISSTYPRTSILGKRKYPPSFARKPDGMYLRKLLGIISYDSVVSLRGSKFGKAITGCSCPVCASTFMHPTKWALKWGRPERRKHFIHTIPDELKSIKFSSPEKFKERILTAQREANRFQKLIRLDLSHLQVWLDFLS